MITKPTVALWQDTRRANKKNQFPIKLRITDKRKPHYYPTNIALTEQEYAIALSSKPGKLKELQIRLHEIERRARLTIDKIVDELHSEFSISLFERLLSINSDQVTNVFYAFTQKIEKLKASNQIKTAIGYETAMNSLKKIHGRDKLIFTEIDRSFLESFEKNLLANGKSLTTIGIYTRCLRTIFNEAIDSQVISQEIYPFGKNRYQIPEPANNKRALEQTDLISLFNYKPEEGSWEEYAKDMWTLSMLCQGMNMKDIANLRYKNIRDRMIVFEREKTKRTKKSSSTSITVYLEDEAISIIEKWKTVGNNPNQYVFAIYSDDNTPLQNLRKVEQAIKMINKYMRKIALQLNIDHDITYYAARHSFATTLKRQGRSVEEIQEFLGHSDKRTTERYLASFADEHKRSIMNNFVQHLKSTTETT